MTDEPDDQTHSQRALASMEQFHIAPNPENYALWFHYSVGKNRELIAEINTVLANNLPFSHDTTTYLYNKYIASSRNQKAIDTAALGAQKVLQEVLKAVHDISSETQSYNNDIDQYLEHISQEFEDESLKNVVKELIAATTTLKDSGQKINYKLEESTREINALRKNLQQVTTEAQRDFLTGIYNRKTFERFIDEQMEIAKEHNGDLCMLMIDIDHFKKFNDTFGHLIGDEVLKIVARTLTDTLKGRDVVARFGGEEFVAFLPDTPLAGAMKVAEAIRATIASKELKRKDTGETYGTITVSIGAASYRPTADTLPTLIKRADDALYQSKHNGRNRVTSE